MTRAAHPQREFSLEISGDSTGVWDGLRLRQVLANLVQNAVKYGASNSAVRVMVRGEGTHLLFDVANKGSAIDPAILSVIFHPLMRGIHRENNDGNSLGLGLYISREIVNAHGGDIRVRSDETSTVFTVRLPRCVDEKHVLETSAQAVAN